MNIQKLENPDRLQELNPLETLRRIGLKDNQTVCDIGAGSGVFTIAASKMTKGKVYALEINDEMLTLICKKTQSEGINNVEVVKVENDFFNVESNIVDVAIIVTVLHEVKLKSTFLLEVKRILNPRGKVAVIEFHKQVTPMGPSIEHRLGENELTELFSKSGFTSQVKFNLGDNFYCAIFEIKDKLELDACNW